MNEFQKRVEEFRTHYHVKYGQILDDETLYFFIRVNEMHHDLRKQLGEFKRELLAPKPTERVGIISYLKMNWKSAAFFLIIILQIFILVYLYKINHEINLSPSQTSLLARPNHN
jgi:hypothetical protein